MTHPTAFVHIHTYHRGYSGLFGDRRYETIHIQESHNGRWTALEPCVKLLLTSFAVGSELYNLSTATSSHFRMTSLLKLGTVAVCGGQWTHEAIQRSCETMQQWRYPIEKITQKRFSSFSPSTWWGNGLKVIYVRQQLTDLARLETLHRNKAKSPDAKEEQVKYHLDLANDLKMQRLNLQQAFKGYQLVSRDPKSTEVNKSVDHLVQVANTLATTVGKTTSA